MKLFYFLSVFIFSATVMGMPKKVSFPLSSDEDYGSLRSSSLQNLAQTHEQYPFYVIASDHIDERPRQSLNALRAYMNNLNGDSVMLRKLLLTKLMAQIAPEVPLSIGSFKTKKNFDEIDKTSPSFSALNQLV